MTVNKADMQLLAKFLDNAERPDTVGRLDMPFRAGDLPGNYVTTLKLNNGNTIQMIVTAE